MSKAFYTFLGMAFVIASLLLLHTAAEAIVLKNEQALDYQERKALYAAAKWDKTCERDFKRMMIDARAENKGYVTAYTLRDNAVVYEVTCFYAAYQGVQTYVYSPTGAVKDARPLPVEWKPRRYEKTTTGMSGFDAVHERLETFYKARGIGDCGSTLQHQLDRKQKRLVLTKLQEQSCDAAERNWNGCHEELNDEAEIEKCLSEVNDPDLWPITFERATQQGPQLD